MKFIIKIGFNSIMIMLIFDKILVLTLRERQTNSVFLIPIKYQLTNGL